MTPPVGWDSLEKSSTDIGDLFEDFGTSSLGLFGGPGTPGTGVAGRGGALEHTPEPESEPNPVPVVIGGDVRRPRKIVHVDPVYPPIALAARIQGVVALRAVLDAEGNVVNLSVVESEPLLDNAARDAVRQWKYEPTVLNGKRVAVVMDVRVAFRLN
jgi:protein TonB